MFAPMLTRFSLLFAMLAALALVATAQENGTAEGTDHADERDNNDSGVIVEGGDEEEEPGPLEINSSNKEPLPFGQIELEYRYTFIGIGGERPYTWRLSEASDALPTGMFLDSETGELSGIPEEEGIFDVTVRLIDAAGEEREKTFELRIRGNPFVLRELAPSTFDGTVDETEYAETAPFRFPLGSDGDCVVYIRQSGGTLTFAMNIEQVFLVRNRVRILLAKDEEPIERVYAIEYDPYNAGYDTYRHLVQLRGNEFSERPSFHPRPHAGWLGRAHTLFAQRWQCEIRINLSELGIMPGTSSTNLLASFEVFDAEEEAVYAPPRDGVGGYGNRSNYVTLRSEDYWGERDEAVLVSTSDIERARERDQNIEYVLGDAIRRMENLQHQLHNLARQVERYREEHGDEELDERTRNMVKELVEEYLEAQREYVRAVDRLLEIDPNFYAYMYKIARDFAAQARDPLPTIEAEELWSNALRFARRTLEFNRRYLPARMLEAQALHRLGRYEEALRRYELLHLNYRRDIALALEVGRMHILIQQRKQREARQLEAELQEVRRTITERERRLEALKEEEAEQPDIQLAEEALAALGERAQRLRAEREEAAREARQQGFEALDVLDAVAARHRDNGRVALACATLLYNLGEREGADRYLTMTLNRVLDGGSLDVAIELISFLGHQNEFERMRFKAERLTEEYDEYAEYHYAVAQEFKRHHHYEEALLYTSKAVERLPESAPQDPRARDEFVRWRNMVVIDLLIALGNAEKWERAASYVYEVQQELGEIAEQQEEEWERGGQPQWWIAWERYRMLAHYPDFAKEEQRAREYDTSLEGTERANPRLKLRFSDPDGEEIGEVEIELFRSDAPDMISHLEQAFEEGWFEEDEERELFGAMIQSVRRAHQLTIGPSGPGTREAPEAPSRLTGRRHFRGSVSLATSARNVGLALQINYAAIPWLNDEDPVIGRVVAGMEVLDRIYDRRSQVEVTWVD